MPHPTIPTQGLGISPGKYGRGDKTAGWQRPSMSMNLESPVGDDAPTPSSPSREARRSSPYSVWNLIIRPRRVEYHLLELGPKEFLAGSQECERRDFDFRTSRGYLLKCSHYVPCGESAQGMPVVIYLHGNAGSRVEAVDLAIPLLQQGMSLVSYDSCGCGLSEGDYLSLGWHESADLLELVQFLRQEAAPQRAVHPTPKVGPVALWGRSMGAATAILSASKMTCLVAMVVDSPFASLRKLAYEVAERQAIQQVVGFQPPGWVVEVALLVVRSRIQALADFDIEEVAPEQFAAECRIPAFYIHAAYDTFLLEHHVRQVYEAHGCEKKYFAQVDGTHNSCRDEKTLKAAMTFFRLAFHDQLGADCRHEVEEVLPRQTLPLRWPISPTSPICPNSPTSPTWPLPPPAPLAPLAQLFSSGDSPGGSSCPPGDEGIPQAPHRMDKDVRPSSIVTRRIVARPPPPHLDGDVVPSEHQETSSGFKQPPLQPCWTVPSPTSAAGKPRWPRRWTDNFADEEAATGVADLGVPTFKVSFETPPSPARSCSSPLLSI
eukprot:TRINITY_DN26041_c0_g1_i1.p1 TRINITY_DN26041_c0_g1~~TRINITY_DN26041_c0_g1_i1.p1  ORF type:complete len:547 (+),score=105.95 TRINITY_DN26041_c0_g1_i1:96-1736(+)